MRRILLSLTIAFGLSIMPLSGLAEQSEVHISQYQAVTMTEDGAINVAVGSVIGRGSKRISVVDGREYAECQLPDVSIGGRGHLSNDEHAEVVVRISNDCELIVESVTVKEEASTLEARLASDTYRAAYSQYRDVAHLQLTGVYAEMKWYWNGSSVSGISHMNGIHQEFPDGWSNNWFNWDWGLTGAANVWAQGNFEFWFGSYNHTHKATLWGYGDGTWFNMCFTSGGTVPGGSWACGSYAI